MPQPWHPSIPSLGPGPSSTRVVSDAVISRLRSSLGEDDPRVPTSTALRLFFGTYFDVFNVHLPLLHAPSFEFHDQPLGLLLAMAAIGAIYRLERNAAALLYRAADTAAPVGTSPLPMGTFRGTPEDLPRVTTGPVRWNNLAYYQTRLLLQYVGTLGGDSELADRSLGMIAELSLTVYRTLARQLKASSGMSDENLTWISWLDRECTKRTLYGIWNLSDFVASTYGIAPPLTIGHDGELELPCSEALWQARTEAEWTKATLAEASHGGAAAATTVREACAVITDNHHRGPPPPTDEETTTAAQNWSPFALVCVMHIISTRLWHISHGTLSWFHAAARAAADGTAPTSAATPAAPQEDEPRGTPLAVGRRCHDLIRACSESLARDAALPGGAGEAPRRQLADAADILRVCYVRAVPALARLDCDTLLRGGTEDVRVAIREFVAAPLERTYEFTVAAGVAYEGLCVPVSYGTQLYRKTGALSGSLENLIAGWDNVLLVSKWAHVVCSAQALGTELDSQEAELLQIIFAMLQQEETEPDEGPLAARLLRYWAAFYDDTWVWGVAPRMAVILRKLASAYEESGQG